MPTDFISYSDTNYFSQFICDYLDESQALKSLYNRFPNLKNFKLQINEKSGNPNLKQNRQVLFEALTKQYQNIEASTQTLQNIKMIPDKNTFTITTGHQLNLLTGPLYFLYKIISTINLTKQLKVTFPDYNFVPIYWMASEDHDFEEINYFNFRGKKIKWHSNQTGAVGRFNLKGLDDVFKVLSHEIENNTHADQLKTWFKDAYLKHDNLSAATRYLTNQFFGDYGLVILDADDSCLKRLFIPHFKQELLDQTEYKTVSKTNKKLTSLGVKIQVNPREINLFYINKNSRERIIFEDDVFKVNNTLIEWSKEELLKHLDQYPERFSPNVIMRPLYQEVILPNLCYIGGGGELAYWFQLKSNFKAHNIVFPILLLRNSVLIKTAKQAQKLNKLQIPDADLFLKRHTFINKRVRKISNIDIDFSAQKQHLEHQFTELQILAKQTDISFLGAVNAQKTKQINGLRYLEKRLLKAQKRKLADQINRATDLQRQLFPNDSLQERYLNFSELYLEYGNELIAQLIKALKPLNGHFTILTL